MIDFYEELDHIDPDMSADEIRKTLNKQIAVWNQRLQADPERASRKIELLKEAMHAFESDAAKAAYDQKLADEKKGAASEAVTDPDAERRARFQKYYDAALKYMADWQDDLAKTAFERALAFVDTTESNADFFRTAAEIYRNCKDYRQALEYINKAIVEDPEHPENYLIKGSIYSIQSNYPEMLENYLTAYRLAEQQDEIFFLEKARACGLLAKYYYQMGDVSKAEYYAKIGAELANGDSLLMLAQIENDREETRLKQEKEERAKERRRREEEIRRQEEERRRQEAERRRQEKEKLEKEFEECFNLLSEYLRNKQYDRAKDVVGKGLKLLGILHEQYMKEYEHARLESEFYHASAMAFDACGDYDEALKHIDAAINITPGYQLSPLILTKAKIYQDQRDEANMIATYQALINRTGNEPSIKGEACGALAAYYWAKFVEYMKQGDTAVADEAKKAAVRFGRLGEDCKNQKSIEVLTLISQQEQEVRRRNEEEQQRRWEESQRQNEEEQQRRWEESQRQNEERKRIRLKREKKIDRVELINKFLLVCCFVLFIPIVIVFGFHGVIIMAALYLFTVFRRAFYEAYFYGDKPSDAQFNDFALAILYSIILLVVGFFIAQDDGLGLWALVVLLNIVLSKLATFLGDKKRQREQQN